MTFKEQLNIDLCQTFFNTNEFAELHELGGKNVPLIIDEDEITERKLKAAEGTYIGEKLILVEIKYFKRIPAEGRSITLDNQEYFVVSCKEADGLLEMVLGVNEP